MQKKKLSGCLFSASLVSGRSVARGEQLFSMGSDLSFCFQGLTFYLFNI